MDWLERVREATEVTPGELPGVATWSVEGLRVVGEGGEEDCYEEGALVALQLSGEVAAREPNWLRRLFGRPGPSVAWLNAEVRGRGGLRLRLRAELPRASERERLARLPLEGAREVPFEALTALLASCVALGARVAEASPALLASESLERTHLPGIYEVSGRLVHIPFAEVDEVTEIREHPDADRLELAIVSGLTFVVRRGSRSEGERVVYLRAGAVIPKDVGEALGIQRYLKRGGKVRRVTLRGVESAGLLLELEGQLDILERIGAEIVARRATILSLEAHPRLGDFEVATVDGRRCVVRAGRFKAGEPVLLVPSGVRVPEPMASGLELSPYLIGGVVKPKRFRGVPSQGLLVKRRLLDGGR